VNSAAQPRSAQNGSKRTTRTCIVNSTRKVYELSSFAPKQLSLLRNFTIRQKKAARSNTIPTEAIEQNLSALSVDAQKRAEKDSQKKAAKAASAEARRAEELASSKILIKRIERNKRKYVTAVQGLEAFGLDIKKVAKDFGKKFATGSSVTKIPGGGEEITVQGDLSEDILEFLVEKFEVPEDNVELIEDKKKKKAEGQVA
jgi:density-regulated protein DRP1